MNMSKNPEPIYIFGFFNPAHQGYIDLAEREFEKTGATIYFVVLPDEASRFFMPSAEKRVAMLEMALENFDRPFHVSKKALEESSYDLYMESKSLPNSNRVIMSYEDSFCLQSGRPHLCTEKFEFEVVEPELKRVQNMSVFMRNQKEREYIEKERLYLIGDLKELLKNNEHRLNHSISVAHLAYEIALSNGLPCPEWAYLAGLWHDAGKEYSEKEALEILRSNLPEMIPVYPGWAYHQFVGAFLFDQKAETFNPFVLNAIMWHATGRKEMSALEKIIYAADKIEPLRGYDSSSMIEECKEDCEKGFLTVLRANRDYLTGKGYKVDNPSTKECFEYYLGDE